MARRKPTAGARPVMRTDLLPSNMTATKEAQVRAVLAAYRRGATMLASEQWRLFFEAGRFNKNQDADKATFAAVIGAANRVQMRRYQVVGQLDSWISNRANEFREVVTRSTLPIPGTCFMPTNGTKIAVVAYATVCSSPRTGRVALCRSVSSPTSVQIVRPAAPLTNQIRSSWRWISVCPRCSPETTVPFLEKTG